PAAPVPYLPLRGARPLGGQAHQRSGGGDVRRADRRDADRRGRPGRRAPLRLLRALALVRPLPTLLRRTLSCRAGVRRPLTVVRPITAIHLRLGPRGAGGRLPCRTGRMRRSRPILSLATATVFLSRLLAAPGSRIGSLAGLLPLPRRLRRCRRLRWR